MQEQCLVSARLWFYRVLRKEAIDGAKFISQSLGRACGANAAVGANAVVYRSASRSRGYQPAGF